MSDAGSESGADLLTPIVVTRATVSRFADVSCGDTHAGRDAADWIGGVGYPSVINELRSETRVWTYANAAGRRVGFGSLGTQRWTLRPGNQRVAVQLLPALGIFAEFQGRPVSGSPKYCYQVLDHLLNEATKRAGEMPLVGLSVLPENEEATHVYRRAGFEFVQQGERSRMLLRLT